MRYICIYSCICALMLIVKNSKSDCVMYGMCNEAQYCLNRHPPKLAVDGLLEKVCNMTSPVQCCDEKQLTALENDLMMLGFLVREYVSILILVNTT